MQVLCTFGGIYIPCVFSHAKKELSKVIKVSVFLAIRTISVEHHEFPLSVDSLSNSLACFIYCCGFCQI